MKKIAVFMILVACGITTAQAKIEKVRDVNQFSQVVQQINGQYTLQLKKLLSQMAPNTTQFSTAQIAQFCQMNQKRIDDNYQAYDANRQLFDGPGALLTKQDYIHQYTIDPITKSLAEQGVNCQYQ